MSQPIYSLCGITTNNVILTLNQNPQFPSCILCRSGVTIYFNPLWTVSHTITYSQSICAGYRRDVKAVKTEGKKKFYERKMDKANGKRFKIQLNAWKSSHQQWESVSRIIITIITIILIYENLLWVNVTGAVAVCWSVNILFVFIFRCKSDGFLSFLFFLFNLMAFVSVVAISMASNLN